VAPCARTARPLLCLRPPPPGLQPLPEGASGTVTCGPHRPATLHVCNVHSPMPINCHWPIKGQRGGFLNVQTGPSCTGSCRSSAGARHPAPGMGETAPLASMHQARTISCMQLLNPLALSARACCFVGLTRTPSPDSRPRSPLSPAAHRAERMVPAMKLLALLVLAPAATGGACPVGVMCEARVASP
jgi:hypothetical protein